MKTNPKVTILMNCYDCQKYLKEAIDSVYAQTFTDWEIIFIDNCSTDNTKNIVTSYDDKIKYYKTPQNMSLCHARIFAKEFITGEFFCVLDTDDLWYPTKLEKQVSIMQEHNDIDIIYTNTLYFTDEGKEEQAYDTVMPNGNVFKQLLENYFFSFETVMVRKSIMDKYNIYFDSKYSVSSDAEFFIRLSYYAKVYYIDEVLAKWRYGHGSESDRSLCIFPKEYEFLLEDLSSMINNFEIEYKNQINSLKEKIDNMYGICHWNNNDKIKAREYFKKALSKNKKYIVPYIFSFLMNYNQYIQLRKKFKKL
jgi:glycosyltransferase involved in cell wall biosynthesis